MIAPRSAALAGVIASTFAGAATGSAAAPPHAPVTAAFARAVLALDGPDAAPGAAACTGDDPTRIRCWLTLAYAATPRDQATALALFDEFGDVAGVEREHDMPGGYRGTLHLVPAWPVGKERRHLGWILDSQRALARFGRDLAARAGVTITYEHRGITWRFFRSVGRRTPSAYAQHWTVAYNVAGSLNTSRERVLATMVHEIFHLNDQARGGWARPALGALVDGIVARCGTDVSCLAPYAPMPTKVRGGTFYAFTPNNGDMAGEYAAELATRYFLEQRAVLAGRPRVGVPWKCLTPENAQAYRALAAEFFGGADLTAACAPPRAPHERRGQPRRSPQAPGRRRCAARPRVRAEARSRRRG